MNRDDKVREYVLKKQMQRERAEQLRAQHRRQEPSSSYDNRYDDGRYGVEKFAKKRIIGDPFADDPADSYVSGPSRGMDRDLPYDRDRHLDRMDSRRIDPRDRWEDERLVRASRSRATSRRDDFDDLGGLGSEPRGGPRVSGAMGGSVGMGGGMGSTSGGIGSSGGGMNHGSSGFSISEDMWKRMQDEVKQVNDFNHELKGQLHALQFQIDTIKSENEVLKQRINTLESRSSSSMMADNNSHHHNRFGGSTTSNNSNNNGMRSMSSSVSAGVSQLSMMDSHSEHTGQIRSNSNNNIHQQQQSNRRVVRGTPHTSRVNGYGQSSSSAKIRASAMDIDQSEPLRMRFSREEESEQSIPSLEQRRPMKSEGEIEDQDNWQLPPPSTADDLLAKLPPDAFEDDNEPRVECDKCGRKFKESALAKHKRICEKVFLRKRKAFNSTKNRVNDEAMKLARNSDATSDQSGVSKAKKKTDWQNQSNALRDAMRRSRAISKAEKEGRDLSTVVMPESTVPDTRIPCPHCGRKFSETAAERHIPRCKNVKARATRR